MRIIVAKFWRY